MIKAAVGVKKIYGGVAMINSSYAIFLTMVMLFSLGACAGGVDKNTPAAAVSGNLNDG